MLDHHPTKLAEAGKHPNGHYGSKAVDAPRPVEILIVEDNTADLLLTKTALRDAGIVHEASAVRNGEQALAFLRRQGKYATATRPDVVLLDLNLPKVSGYEVLAEMRADKDLQRIPVIVLSGIEVPEDLKTGDEQHPTTYLVKPFRLKEYLFITRAIKEICDLVELPTH